MSQNTYDQSEFVVTQTLARQFSLGLNVLLFRPNSIETEYPKSYFVMPTFHVLLLRNNEDGRQSNLYFGAGAGAARNQNSSVISPAMGFFAEGDTETRSVYLSASFCSLMTPNETRQFWQSKLRAGYSPFLAALGGLHIVGLLEGELKSQKPKGDLFPLLRFSHQNVLWEMGASARGRWKFNWMVEL
jgi:hypothetical protein